MHSRSVPALWVALLALGPTVAPGCKQSEPEQPPAKTPALTAAPPSTPAPAAPDTKPPPTAASDVEQTPGWSRVSLQDSLPLCVFRSYEAREAAPVFQNAKKQTLKANVPVVFGVYGPWCLNQACDDRVLLQCWAERDGATLTVHTRFASLRKDGTDCSADCMVVDAACETPPLEAGEYTIRHGDRTYPLKIPGVVRSPCFDPKADRAGPSR